MATRDRTPAFEKIKAEYKNRRPTRPVVGGSNFYEPDIDHHDNNIPLVERKNKDANNIQLKSLNVLPAWMQRVNDIDSNLTKIKTQIEKLSELHAKHVLPTFDGESQSDLERNIEILTSEITRLFHVTHQIIKTLGSDAKLSQEDTKMKKNIQTSKSAKLQNLSLTFRQKQRTYLSNLQRSSNSFSDWDQNYDNKEEELIEDIDLDFTMEQKKYVNVLEFEVNARDQEIRKTLASIQELSHLFQDISLLVVQQGSLLDQIEYNLDQTEQFVHDGGVEVEKTNQYHKEYRTRLCILLVLVALIVAMIFIMIIKAII
ncbi:hypothetical protein CYY_006330 [Polysphondylium violaceum]|uniref:t-SNARE coiled-coil homology domain-containing protein n=1 Tax=Polysphondylium violaceum TaxID=133409 RepID=A0A8J4UY95_9MYCE|nr:hypothetical protein CYY_006330 [Polysphondylium violaceum]